MLTNEFFTNFDENSHYPEGGRLMKRIIAVIAVLTTLAVPVICTASPANPGAYVSGFLGVNVTQDTDAASTDFITGNTFNDRLEFDPGISIGGTGGYDFGFVRLEGELSYKHAEIDSITDQNGFRFQSANGSIGAQAMMINGFIDLHNNSRLTPYLGGGIGAAALYLSDTTGIDTSGGTAQRVTLYGEADDAVFAYQVGAGMEIDINRFYSLDIGYRYFVTDTGTFDSDLGITTSLKFKSHSANVGFRFKF
jgi:opacity protein-like surface antigen